MYEKKREGVYMDAGKGRLICHKDGKTTYYWSESMLDYLRRKFPRTLNAEMAEHLGMSESTIIRKARELGLTKDSVWLRSVWQEHVKIGHIVSRCKGYPGTWKKGQRVNPSGEFKPGHRLTPEQEERRSQAMRRWWQEHRNEAHERACRAWETRRRNEENPEQPIGGNI